jgi:hypothetical protein
MHMPLTHDLPDGQTLPQAPQLFRSIARLTQTPLQLVSPAWQLRAQVPLEQIWPAGQARPQAPQLPLSVWRLVQMPLQLVRPA